MLSVKSVFLALLLSSTSLAAPIRREVPQEHSHEPFLTSVRASLNLNNPDKIQDPVFALLGDAAASAGKGNIADVTCLQQATADQAFTNAKAKSDIQGMTDALIYRALERNSGSVGGVTKTCTSLKATNPEIAAVQQHQDPASTNAAAGNKAIVLELAKQIASIGGDPQQALKSGTFKAGTIGDSTGKGNSCDDANDANGCIFTQNLLVEDATAAEISAAVAGVAAATGAAAAAATTAAAAATTVAAAAGATDTCPPQSTVTVTVQPTAAAAAATDATAASTAALAVSTGTSGSFGNFGSCPLPLIKFGVGFDNRKETSFEPQDQTAYAHGSAQAVGIIEQFMCDNLVNKCGADATAKATCASAKTAVSALPAADLKFGIAADTWNGAFGVSSNFRNTGAVDDQGNAVAGSTGGNVAVAAAPAAAAGAAATAALVAAIPVDTATSTAAGNFGSCPLPLIKFGVGFDNRKETSFEPVDQTAYAHGSAQAVGIITQFMCDNLVNKCGADATAKATCASAKTAVAALTTAQLKFGIAADTWNAAFGSSSQFAQVTAVDDQGNAVAGSTGGSVAAAAPAAAAAATTAAAAAATTAAAAAPAATTAAAAASNGAAAATGANVQTFTGALGGATAPPVTVGGSKGFVVDNSEFINKAGALGRSCDVQHNQCANLANSGSSTFKVSDCDAQNTACHAAITA